MISLTWVCFSIWVVVCFKFLGLFFSCGFDDFFGFMGLICWRFRWRMVFGYGKCEHRRWWPWRVARGELVAHEWVSGFVWNLHEWIFGFVWDLCDWVCSNLGILALVLGLWILFAGGFVVDWKMRKSGFELWFWIPGFLGFCSCFYVLVCSCFNYFILFYCYSKFLIIF